MQKQQTAKNADLGLRSQDSASSHIQALEDLNIRNSLLISQKDELSKQNLEQADQLTGTEQSTSSLHSPSGTTAFRVNKNCFISEIKTNVESAKRLEKDLAEERSRYQSLLSEHLHLEERHRDAKDEMNLSAVRNTSLTTWSLHLMASHQKVQSFMRTFLQSDSSLQRYTQRMCLYQHVKGSQCVSVQMTCDIRSGFFMIE